MGSRVVVDGLRSRVLLKTGKDRKVQATQLGNSFFDLPPQPWTAELSFFVRERQGQPLIARRADVSDQWLRDLGYGLDYADLPLDSFAGVA